MIWQSNIVGGDFSKRFYLSRPLYCVNFRDRNFLFFMWSYRFWLLCRNNYDETLIICIELVKSLFSIDKFKWFEPNLFEPLTHN